MEEVLNWGKLLCSVRRWEVVLVLQSLLEGQHCPGGAGAGGRMEIREGNKWNLNIHMLPGQASSRSHLLKWSVEGKCLWNTFPFFRSFLCCGWISEPVFAVRLLPVLSLPRPPPKDHSLTLPWSELGLELFLCQRIVFYLVFHLPVSVWDLKSKILKWKLCAWQGESHLMPMVPWKLCCHAG